MYDIEEGIKFKPNELTEKILLGIVNDFMDLQFGVRTNYTTGKRVLPSGITIDDLDDAISDPSTPAKFKIVFKKISDTEKSGDLTPQSRNDGSWDPELEPVLLLIQTKA